MMNTSTSMVTENKIFDLRSIHNRCINDHSRYIKSYINHNLGEEIQKSYKEGEERYMQMKKLMKDITITHPQLMSFMLHPVDSGTSTRDIERSIHNEYVAKGGNYSQYGGDREQMNKVIDKVKEMFDMVKTIDSTKMKEITDELLERLNHIDDRLKKIANTDVSTVDPNIVINNMSAVVTSLKNFDPTSKSYDRFTKGYDLYLPLKSFESIDMKSVDHMSKLIDDVLNSYLESLRVDPKMKDIIKVMFTQFTAQDILSGLSEIKKEIVSKSDPSSKNLSSTIDRITGELLDDKFTLSRRYDIFNRHIRPLLSTIDTKVDKSKLENIENRYLKVKDNLVIKQKDLKEFVDRLESTTDDINRYLYGDVSDDEIKKFASIKSYLLPKIRYIMMIIKLYIDHVETDKDDLKSVMVRLYDRYSKIKIYGYSIIQDDLLETTERIIDHLVVYKQIRSINYDNNTDLLEALKKFTASCDIEDINKKIAIFNEKAQSNDLVEFIKLYNTVLNTNKGHMVVDELNRFVSRAYQQMLKVEILKENFSSVDKHIKAVSDKLHKAEKIRSNLEIVRSLNVSKIKSMTTLDVETFKTLRPIVDDIIDKRFPDNKVSKDKALNELLQDKGFIASLNNNIRNVTDERNFMHAYNQATFNIDKTGLANLELLPELRLIPSTYFLRDYTERIYNNVFKNIDEHRLSKTKLLEDLVESSLKSSSVDDVDMIYQPDFKQIKKMMDETKKQRGGTLNVLVDNMISLSQSKMEYMMDIGRYKDASDAYVVAYNDVYAYTRYLILIATNQLFTDNYVVYNYLNKGLIELYKRIVSKIVQDLDNGDSEPHIVYIRRYYNVIVRRLNYFLSKLSMYMSDSSDLIDIRNIDTTSIEIRNDMILLNYFKPIIESYNEMFQNQITIYARLNDIVGEIDYDSKVFISDHEKYKNDGCGYKIINAVKNEDQLKELCLPSKTSNIDMGGESSVMWTRYNTCNSIANSTTNSTAKDFNYEEPVVFTEVFDTPNFPENGDISKYMTLETQLAKKKGVCVLTYGYSGTGKTYTLFGNNSKLGVLQSTLTNINGLYKIKFRLFEIYGRGLPYDFYWNSTDKKSRMDKISHNIFHYRLETVNSMIKVQETDSDIVSIQPKDFLKYIENDTDTLARNPYDIPDTYIDIKGFEVKDVFNNFSDFTTSIDSYRKGEKGNTDIKTIKRIRETPNNPESSRSILVYDFKLYVGEDTGVERESDSVRFLIIDLPGREEINQTYIEPYLNNIFINNMLSGTTKPQTVTLGQNSVTSSLPIERIRMIITCMALNPMALAVFQPSVIFNTINEQPKQVRDIVFGDLGAGDITEEYSINELGGKLSLMITLEPDKTGGVVAKIKDKVERSGFGYSTKYQIYGVCAVYMIYRLIENNRFDILELIYAKIVKDEINDVISRKIDEIDTRTDSEQIYVLLKGLVETRFKGENTSNSVRQLVQNITNRAPAKEMTTLDYVSSSADLIRKLKSTDPQNAEKISEIKRMLKKILYYDYLMTPLEGIYINENIIGLIKFLSDKLVKDASAATKIDVLNRKRVEQRKMLIKNQRDIARCWLMSKSEDYMNAKREKSDAKTNIDYMVNILFKLSDYSQSYFPWDKDRKYLNNVYSGIYAESVDSGGFKVDLMYDQLVKQQRYLISTYASDKIYNFDKPVITDILSPYIEDETKSDEYNREAIKDYKMFYLFGNYDSSQKTQFKCEHQIKLLKNTENFIKAIAN